MMLCATTAHADVVTDWNQTALEVLKAGNVPGNPWSRAMAMVHVAMSDAINSVQGRYKRYVVRRARRAQRLGRSRGRVGGAADFTPARAGAENQDR